MLRELFDAQGWRRAGLEEYAYVTEASRYLNGTRGLQVVVAVLAMVMLPLSVVMQFNPAGPQSPAARLIHFGVAFIGFLLGLRWLLGPWPTARQATWFLFLSDALIGLGVSMLAEPIARICGAIHLAMLGLFAAFFLGWRILVVHCVYALLLIGGLTAYAILAEGHTPMQMYAYTTPAIATVVGLPVVIQVVVEAGRHGMTRVSREWYIDSLTGVYNRRGLGLAIRRARVRATPDTVLLVGVLDLDGFKQYNDSRGHAAGDELLVDVATALNAIPRLIVGRNGGDEFAVFAVRDGRDDASRTVDEIRALLRDRGSSGAGIPASAGVVLASGSEYERVEVLVRDADAALYEAKDSPADTLVVRDRMVGAR